MNFGLILSGGLGQRMRSSGLPKQFLKLYGKPIIIYTLEKFENCEDIDEIVIVCHGEWIEYMEQLVKQFNLKKVSAIVVGGSDRQDSLRNGIYRISQMSNDDDIVVIHDGVRPLVSESTIHENIRVTKQHGNAMTVKAVTESVVITNQETAQMSNFQKRSDTYTLTSPQSFKVKELVDAFEELKKCSNTRMPLLDASLVYAQLGKEINLVKVQEQSIKITTAEDFYYLRSILELEENKYILGL